MKKQFSFLPCAILAFAGVSQAALSGYVKLPDSTPVSGVYMALKSSGAVVQTDAAGFYEFTQANIEGIRSVSLNAFQGNIKVSLFDMNGNALMQREVSGSLNFESLTENLAYGLYVVKIQAESEKAVVRMSKSSKGEVFQNVGKSLKKALTTADSLIVSYEGKRVGAVAVMDDEALMDDIFVTHKVVSGSIPASASTGYAVSLDFAGSDGLNSSAVASVDVTNKTYTANSPWSLYVAGRTWNISAGKSAVTGVDDATQKVTLNIEDESAGLASTSLEYSASLELNSTDYSFVTVDLNSANVATALGISAGEIATKATYYAVNPDGTLDSVATAEGNGHWFDGNGNVCLYSDAGSAVYSEMDLTAMTTKVGQYPARLTAGTTYTVKQALRYGNNMVVFTIHLTMSAATAVSSSSATPVVASSSSVASSSATAVSSASTSKTTYDLNTMYSTQPDSIWKFVDWVWKNRQASGKLDDIVKSSNLIFHQIIEGKGELNYCVKWQSAQSLSKANRDKVEPMLNRMINAWVKELVGYENWPYDTVKVHVIGWAADNASKFPDATTEKIYTSYTQSDESFPSVTLPRCPDACSRPDHYYNKSYDYSSCEMGQRFDMSIWATDGFNGGAGGDWGQRISTDAFLSTLDYDFPHIAGHEVGHGFGLDDFYETYQIPDVNYSDLPCSNYTSCPNSGYNGSWAIVPKMVMWAGAAMEITPADAWMLRRTWTGIKNQFGY